MQPTPLLQILRESWEFQLCAAAVGIAFGLICIAIGPVPGMFWLLIPAGLVLVLVGAVLGPRADAIATRRGRKRIRKELGLPPEEGA